MRRNERLNTTMDNIRDDKLRLMRGAGLWEGAGRRVEEKVKFVSKYKSKFCHSLIPIHIKLNLSHTNTQIRINYTYIIMYTRKK